MSQSAVKGSAPVVSHFFLKVTVDEHQLRKWPMNLFEGSCPKDSLYNSPCTPEQEGLRCEYGEHECCGVRSPNFVMECFSGLWAGYYVDTLCVLGITEIQFFIVIINILSQVILVRTLLSQRHLLLFFGKIDKMWYECKEHAIPWNDFEIFCNCLLNHFP